MQETSLAELIPPERVVFLECSSKREALEDLVGSIVEDRSSRRYRDYLDAVMDRENLLSTGIGMGFALPHGKIPDEKVFYLALGICRNGINEYGSLDDKPVNVIVCIVGPNDRQTQYIRILALITKFLKAEGDRILECSSPGEVAEIVCKY